jgi:hypothetical protein
MKSTLFQREYVYVGKTAAGERVLMTGRIYEESAAEAQTVTHESIIDQHCLSLTSAVFTGRKNISRNHVTSGATLEHLAKITVPAPGWTLEEVRELHRIGTEWHLNTMRAGCVHMDLPEDGSYEARKNILCPETGYKYGAEWLTDPLPKEVEERFCVLMSLGKKEEADY